MITYYTTNPLEIEPLEALLIKGGVIYELKRREADQQIVLEVFGVPLDSKRAIKWLNTRKDG